MKLSLHGRVGAVALVGALALTLTACGSDDPIGNGATNGSPTEGEAPSGLSGELSGAGATSQEKAMDAWRAGFQSLNADVSVNYDPVGSSGGRQQFIDGGVAWAGSDSALKPEEIDAAAERCEAIDIPVYISPIAVVFNLEGVTSLNLSAETIANIFAGKITSWDDAAIKADNPDVELPATAITPVHRSDGSGTTKNFTDYLNKAAGGAWADEAADDWPLEGGESGNGTSGLIQAVQAGQGTIGYADESAAGSLGKVSIKVGDAFVAPTAEAAGAALAASPREEDRAEHDIAIKVDRTTTAAGAYPLILVSYAVACLEYEDAETADLVKGFLGYMVSDEGQAASQQAAGSAPLPAELAADAKAAVEAIAGA
ncbi:phosphate ABC transporter substrate-binding protein PstS [Cellulomonas gilvus]|uniref:Phosphate-binding protein n=1 Tax=Cellulomonas gilvus (strain ATCC 13127 / NRRL B-14078) TaxID=593907 RepID=F8A4U4_CELGA|nr:phosphate ABC transporter substrate-binding protein PstS [Cellulomonas gilvus]AEI10910.1 phosphate ABC transporter, periplasmic phosphate-binding protein [Cellulomonas gilvus ATCC 13127]